MSTKLPGMFEGFRDERPTNRPPGISGSCTDTIVHCTILRGNLIVLYSVYYCILRVDFIPGLEGDEAEGRFVAKEKSKIKI
jgi:hypothetical protein